VVGTGPCSKLGFYYQSWALILNFQLTTDDSDNQLLISSNHELKTTIGSTKQRTPAMTSNHQLMPAIKTQRSATVTRNIQELILQNKSYSNDQQSPTDACK
jgi:hypothetical protein